MKRILDFFKNQNGKPWYKQWWPYAVALMYLLVVLKTATFQQGEGWELQRYDGKVLPISSENGEISGTIGLEREDAVLKATYNLYITAGLGQNEVCYTCERDHAFSRTCSEIEKYNYAGQIEGKGFSSKGLSGLLAPVFCEEFVKPKSPVGMIVPWSNATCPLGNSGDDVSTSRFYFNGVAVFESYEEVFWLDEFKVFDAQRFTIRDSCHEGSAGSSFQQTDVEKTVNFGENVRSFKLVFEK